MADPLSSIADLRKSYERAELDEQASKADPLHQFEQWLQEAIDAQVPEPNAMTLATVDAQLRPSTRVVLIKGLDERGIVWYTNYDSRKGQALAGNPFAALQFHWVELEVPAVADTIKGFEVDTWWGLVGPANLPREVTARLHQAFAGALQQPEVKSRFAQLMAEPVANTPEQFGAFMKQELAKYEGVVKASGAKVD